jgi:hypothetical protein
MVIQKKTDFSYELLYADSKAESRNFTSCHSFVVSVSDSMYVIEVSMV